MILIFYIQQVQHPDAGGPAGRQWAQLQAHRVPSGSERGVPIGSEGGGGRRGGRVPERLRRVRGAAVLLQRCVR